MSYARHCGIAYNTRVLMYCHMHAPGLSSPDATFDNNSTIWVLVLPYSMSWQCIVAFLDSKVGGGHLGEQSTMGKISSRYWWPKMRRDVKRYCKMCVTCNRIKHTTAKGEHPYLYTHAPVLAPFYQLGVDVVGPLPVTTAGNKFIVVFTD